MYVYFAIFFMRLVNSIQCIFIGCVQVWSQPVASSVTHPQQVTLTSSQPVLVTISGQQSSVDLWLSQLVDVTSGRQVLVFEATPANPADDDYSGVSIDNVELIAGTCASVGT